MNYELKIAHINIGSNIGDSRSAIERAVAAVFSLSQPVPIQPNRWNGGSPDASPSSAQCAVLQAIADRFPRRSTIVESEPWGFESPNKFLNIGVEILTDLPPLELINHLQEIERRISPESHRNPDGTYRDRLIDLDLIFLLPLHHPPLPQTSPQTLPQTPIPQTLPPISPQIPLPFSFSSPKYPSESRAASRPVIDQCETPSGKTKPKTCFGKNEGETPSGNAKLETCFGKNGEEIRSNAGQKQIRVRFLERKLEVCNPPQLEGCTPPQLEGCSPSQLEGCNPLYLLSHSLQINHPRLILPHPRAAQRDFVMKPIEELWS